MEKSNNNIKNKNCEILISPIPGTIIDIKVKEGQLVKKGQEILTLEAMKLENEILAPKDGKILSINTAKGKDIKPKEPLVYII